jgi:uncharacterized membrane protein YedE/YeeE
MPVFVSGLPLHVLMVHAVVVLVPLSVLGALFVALWPAARRRFGWLVVGLTAVATVSVPIAMGSGDDLRARLQPSDLIEQHAHLGDQLLIFVIALLVFTLALVWFDHYRSKQETEVRNGRVLFVVAAVLVVGFAVTSAVQVVRIGDSGAKAAWSDTEYVAPAANHG